MNFVSKENAVDFVAKAKIIDTQGICQNLGLSIKNSRFGFSGDESTILATS